MKHYDTIIIGGGISGISFAHTLDKQSNQKLCVFEKDEIGGCIKTAQYKDLWFELGAHTIYNSYANTISFLRETNIERDIITRNKHPFLFVNSNSKIGSILKNLNLFSLAFNYIKNYKICKTNKSISEYSDKIFGKKNYSNTLKYCFDAVLSQDSENFPMEYLFKKYKKDKSLPRSFTFNNGLTTLFKNTDNITKHNLKVTDVHKENGKWIVSTDSEHYTATNICIATEWNATKKLIKNILPTINKHPYQPKTSNIKSIAIVTTKDKTKHLRNISGLIGKQQFFFSMVSRDVVDNENYRAFTFHCKDINKSHEEQQNKICTILKIGSTDILHIESKYNSLPMYHKKHSLFITDLKKELNQVQGLFITGNFFDRLAIENCIKRSNNEAYRLLKHGELI